jgi:predicted GNAT family acetyltransferase
MNIPVTHNESHQRFETTIDGQRCVCDYQLRGKVMWMTHTGVPSAVGGRGIAAALVRVALEWAAQQGFTVEPSCSYVDVYMRRHPETQRLRAR